MIGNWPKVIYKEEGMREGMQIEDANISVDDKVRLLDSLSETGLRHIVVGSFVSPKWTPQMARIDEIVSRFTPKAGVTYTALALNERGIERAKQYSPPLTIERDKWPRLNCHMCDAFVRRNTNRSQMQEIERWPQIVAQAQELSVKEAGIGTNASWGSNFLGDFPVDTLMIMLDKQHQLWDEAGDQGHQRQHGRPHELVQARQGRGQHRSRQGEVARGQTLQDALPQRPQHGHRLGLRRAARPGA